MRLLLDTHALLWLFSGNPRLSSTALHAIQAPESTNFLSMASVWEIAIKLSLGKLRMGGDPVGRIMQRAAVDGILRLPIEATHCSAVVSLPLHHRDPFDRMLIAQARHEDLGVVSADPAFDAYGIERIW